MPIGVPEQRVLHVVRHILRNSFIASILTKTPSTEEASTAVIAIPAAILLRIIRMMARLSL